MNKILNQNIFKNLDAYNDEAYIWATKVYDSAKDIKEVSELNIDLVSFAFANVYNHFLSLLGYPSGDLETWLQDFYEKEDIKKEWAMMGDYQDIVSGLIFSAYGNSDIKIYNSLIESVKHEIEDDYGKKVMVDPIDNDSNSHYKHEEIMSFVVSRFKY